MIDRSTILTPNKIYWDDDAHDLLIKAGFIPVKSTLPYFEDQSDTASVKRRQDRIKANKIFGLPLVRFLNCATGSSDCDSRPYIALMDQHTSEDGKWICFAHQLFFVDRLSALEFKLM
jgi:hypothetical protein